MTTPKDIIAAIHDLAIAPLVMMDWAIAAGVKRDEIVCHVSHWMSATKHVAVGYGISEKEYLEMCRDSVLRVLEKAELRISTSPTADAREISNVDQRLAALRDAYTNLIQQVPS